MRANSTAAGSKSSLYFLFFVSFAIIEQIAVLTASEGCSHGRYGALRALKAVFTAGKSERLQREKEHTTGCTQSLSVLRRPFPCVLQHSKRVKSLKELTQVELASF